MVLEPAVVLAQWPRDVRAAGAGVSRQADREHPTRGGVALPAVRHLRARRAARHRPSPRRARAAGGKALRSAFILRALAIERWTRGVILALLGVAVVKLRSTQVTLQDLFRKDLKALDPFFRQINFQVSDSNTIHSIETVLRAKPSTLNVIAVGLIGYGALQIVEGVGLWSLKRWGEYVAVIGTTLFIPLEVYELVEKISWLKITVLVVNVGAVAYLWVSKRLFGIRGGSMAYEQQLHEVSLLEVATSSAS